MKFELGFTIGYLILYRIEMQPCLVKYALKSNCCPKHFS